MEDKSSIPNTRRNQTQPPTSRSAAASLSCMTSSESFFLEARLRGTPGRVGVTITLRGFVTLPRATAPCEWLVLVVDLVSVGKERRTYAAISCASSMTSTNWSWARSEYFTLLMTRRRRWSGSWAGSGILSDRYRGSRKRSIGRLARLKGR